MLILATILAAAGCAARPAAPPPAPPAGEPLRATGAASALTRLTSDPLDERYPSVSPDGQTLLFTAGTFRDIWIPVSTTIVGIDPNNPGGRTVFTSNGSWAATAAWVADGSTFLFTTNSTGADSLVRALTAAPGAGVTVVVGGNAAPEASSPSTSPDGTRVAFNALTNGTWQIAVANLDGSHLTFLGEGYQPSWAPDGSRLAFHRTVNGNNQLFLIDPTSGAGLTQLTSDASDNWHASWSPDSRFVAFTRGRRPQPNVYIGNVFVLRRDGTQLTQLTDGTGNAWWPFWGRDGWIYFTYYAPGTNTSNDIWRLRPGGELAASATSSHAP